jgi:hypothetical protein
LLSPKNRKKWPKNGINKHKLVIFAKTGRNLKKATVLFLTFFTPNFMPSFGKILGAVSEIIRNGRMDARMHGRTDKPDYIGSFGFQPGTKNWTLKW